VSHRELTKRYPATGSVAERRRVSLQESTSRVLGCAAQASTPTAITRMKSTGKEDCP